MENIFLTGYSLRAPSSSNPRDFYEHLRDGVDMTSPTQRYPEGYLGLPPRTGTLPAINRFDQDFFKFSTKQTEKMDVAIRLLLEVTHEALMDAQLPIDQLRGTKTGVYVGHCFSDYLTRSTHDKALTGYELVNGAHTMAANKISFFYDFKGPSMAIDTACSSSLVALHQAVSDIRSGVVDRAVVSGLSLTLDPRKNATFNAFTMLSPDGKCFTFDTRANGYCRSEGVVSVVLESGRMCRGGVCRVLGTSVNSDGFKDKGITFPSGFDQAANALAALNAGGVNPASVSYVEAHGTGTVAGDKQELDGLSRAFYGDAGTGPEPGSEGNADAAAANGSAFRNIAIGSVKSAMGHAEGASGLMSVVKCLAMMEHKKLIPNQNFVETTHPPLLDGRFRVVTELEDWVPGICCISNYGFGGTNAFCVLAPPGDNAVATIPPAITLLPPPPQLEETARSLRFSNSSSTDFSGVSPQWLAQQVALGNDKGFKFRGGGKKVGSKGGYDSLCFVFGGQGSQWPHMGKRLMSECPSFKQTMARLTAYLTPLDPTLDLVSLFESQGEQWMQKRYTVLGIAAYQIASVNLLAEAGLVPDFYMGHSLGETAAGYAKGMQSEEETIKIAYVRSCLSSKIKPGGFFLKTKAKRGKGELELICESRGFFYYDLVDASCAATVELNKSEGDEVFDLRGQMVAVGLPADEVNSAIGALGLRQTCVACFNGPRGQTVSGAATEVASLKSYLAGVHGESLFWREVDTDGVAYHAPYLECYYDFLVSEFETILGKEGGAGGGSGGTRPLDGGWVPTSIEQTEPMGASSSSGLVLDAHFHARNITSPVYFMQAIQALPPNTLVLEVGSAQSLLGQVKRVRGDVGLAGLATRGDPASEGVYLSKDNLRHALWEAGYTKAFQGVGSPLSALLPPSRGGWRPAATATSVVVPAAGKGQQQQMVALQAVAGVGEGLADAVLAMPLLPTKELNGAEATAARTPSFAHRWPDLWDHSREQRVFTYRDFQLKVPKEGAGGGENGGGCEEEVDDDDDAVNGGVVVRFEVAGKDAFLMDHKVNGRALFPATGHLFTMYTAALKDQNLNLKASEQGLRFRDFEVLTAVVLDPTAVPTLSFHVVQLEQSLSVLHRGEVVARARFDVLPSNYVPAHKLDGVSSAAAEAAAEAPVEASAGRACDDDKLAWLERGQLYNHFKRYGYEYQEEFQLVTRRTVPIRPAAAGVAGAVGCGVLRGACHAIPFLDNFLQLFLEDLSMLNLPTLVRECELLPGCFEEALKGARVCIDTASGASTLTSDCVVMRGLHTMPAAGPVHPQLTHQGHVFVGLGEQWRHDPRTEAAFEATRKFTANSITSHVAANPQLLARKPWLANVLRHAKQWVVSGSEVEVDAALYATSLHYRMHVDLYSEATVEKLLERPFLTLSLHPEHDAFYETNTVMASSDAELAGLVGLVRKEWHGVDQLSVFEGGSGSCGFTRRVVPLLGKQLGSYTCSDISAIRLGTLAGHPKISSAKHDLNSPLAAALGQHHLILANNAIHTACDVGKTLAHFRDGLVEGGFVLLEEQVTDACLYLWGLDDFIWTTATDTRSFGLWMSWKEWEAVIEGCAGLELLCCHKSPYHVTMLLRKTATTAAAAAAATTVVSAAAWSELSKCLNSPPTDKGERRGVVVHGAGAEGLVKTLRLEQGIASSNVTLQTLVNLDAVAAGACPPLPLPLTFNHVQGGQVGSLVVVPLHLRRQLCDTATSSSSVGELKGNAEKEGSGNVQLHIVRPGDLSTLTWIEAPSEPHAFCVAVAYSSLNFKDVMYAFGKLRLESPSFGLEFSGTETVGSNGSSTQRRVMGIGTSACIAKRAKPTLCWDVPDGMSLDEAATVPVVYATALFALFEKANLRKGQSVLVHAGSGGVGHAAIFLCQARGIEVFTTCSEAKRAYVLEAFGLDEAHVSNSRDASFRESVLRATSGQGVDCVLNSLSGSLLDASLQCVKSFGHFCEIGKFDLQNNTPIGLKALERNVSYHAIDLASMFTHPRLSVVLKELLDDALDKKQVKPLPRTVFEAQEVEQALRFMSSGKHKGKVLVKMEGFKPTAAGTEAAAAGATAGTTNELSPRFTTSGTHVVTGGLGGFGLELTKWLLEQGASKVVCTGRSGITSGWQRYRAEALWAKYGAGALEVSSLDVREEGQCKQLLELCNGGDGTRETKGFGVLKGVWHVAMVLQDTLFQNMTSEKWDTCNGVKVKGLEHLDNLTQTLLPPHQLDAFVAFSSVSSLFGNVGQANYAHANAACETIVQARVSAGLKGCAVQWGMIDNVGFFGANDAKLLETFLAFQNIDASLFSLHSLLKAGGVVTSYRLAADKEASGGDAAGDEAAFELSVPAIQAKFAEILGGKGGDYDPDSPLNDYGLDSLSSIEVVNWMNRHTTLSVNPSFMTPEMTINKMHAHMAANQKQ